MNAMEAVNHRRVRGYILRGLNLYPTEHLNTDLIGDFVRNCGGTCLNTEIPGHLTYLQSKGYVEIEERQNPLSNSAKVIMAKITPKGVDLIEGNIGQEPGILL